MRMPVVEMGVVRQFFNSCLQYAPLTDKPFRLEIPVLDF